MADVNETIVKLYFEAKGFFVQSNLKYHVQDKHITVGGDSDIDLLILNTTLGVKRDLQFVLKDDDVTAIKCAAIEVKGWHTESFSPSVINNSPRIFNFLRPTAITEAEKKLNTKDFKKILVLSSLGVEKRAESEAIFTKKGIDHVIEFEQIINHLYKMVESNKAYSSEVLQTLRLVKKYVPEHA